jgi:hypothetical protein
MRRWMVLLTVLALTVGAAWGESNGKTKAANDSGSDCCCCSGEGGESAADCVRPSACAR